MAGVTKARANCLRCDSSRLIGLIDTQDIACWIVAMDSARKSTSSTPLGHICIGANLHMAPLTLSKLQKLGKTLTK